MLEQATKWFIGIVSSSILGLISVVYVGISSDIEEHNANAMAILSKIELMAVQSVQTRSDLQAHIEESKYWKDEITELRHQVTTLREDASARKDPFTGTEGRYLKEQVERLERLVDDVSRGLVDHISKDKKHKQKQ